MSYTQDRPIATLITEDIARCLSQVNVDQGFNVTLRVERLNQDNHELNKLEHLLAVIVPGDPEKQENYAEGQDEFVRTYLIMICLLPSQGDGVPIDQWIDYAVADTVKALCDDTNIAIRTRGGLAIDTDAGDPTTIGPMPNSLAYWVSVPIDVRYTTRTRNPYLQT